MKSQISTSGEALLEDPEDFSFVLGGPLFQLLRRVNLSDNALSLLRKRVIVISLLAWLPLLILSTLEGFFTDWKTSVPFLLDIEVHIRFLVAMPLLVIAELVVHQRMRPLVKQFLERNLIPEHAMTRFHEALESASRLRNSVIIELFLIAFVYFVGIEIIWRNYLKLNAASWYATALAQGSNLSWAGFWYGYVSLPMFQFLLIRWYFRLFIWVRFLFQIASIRLQLIPTHPDRLGGLGFLANMVYAFTPLLIAHGSLLAGQLASRIFYTGAGLLDYKVEIALVTIFLLCFFLGPFLIFTPLLAQVRWVGNREYGTLAQRYVREFDLKWLRGGAPVGEPLVGSADIQSLADMSNSFEVVKNMNIVLVTKEAVLQLALASLLPMAPLLLTMMPLEELLKKLLGILI